MICYLKEFEQGLPKLYLDSKFEKEMTYDDAIVALSKKGQIALEIKTDDQTEYIFPTSVIKKTTEQGNLMYFVFISPEFDGFEDSKFVAYASDFIL